MVLEEAQLQSAGKPPSFEDEVHSQGHWTQDVTKDSVQAVDVQLSWRMDKKLYIYSKIYRNLFDKMLSEFWQTSRYLMMHVNAKSIVIQLI